jgi:ABC-type phosphate transport system permease subunit
MQLNVMTEKLDRLCSIVRASSRKEAAKADFVREGTFDLGLTWMWVMHLSESAVHVARLARTAGVRLAAKEAMAELAPLIVAGAERGDPMLKAWEAQARKFLGKHPQIPKLSIFSAKRLRGLDFREL